MNIIYQENCLDTMSREELQNQVDIIVTSPPYNTSRVGASDKYSSRYDQYQAGYFGATPYVISDYSNLIKDYED